MSAHKKFDTICVAVLVIAIALTVLFMNGKSLGITAVTDEESEAYSDSAYFTSSDHNGDWSGYDVTTVTLSGDTATISGGGAYVYDGGLVISESGWYELSGSLTDGSITVDANSNSKVYFRLSDVSVSCSDSAALIVNQADKVFLTLTDGTVNTLASGAEYSTAALSDGVGGTIYAKDDLTINGSGTLNITAEYKHGIEANDDLVITGGAIIINAAKDGINANDTIRITKASVAIDAADEAIQQKTEEGYIYIESGTFDLTSADDGIKAVGSITIEDGDFAISAGDDAVHSDSDITVNGGSIVITGCYEGIEALNITQNGGNIEIYPTDDGLNANGNGGSVTITGGALTIMNSDGNDADGLDSNGSVYITGGAVTVAVLGNGSNNAIDYGSESGGEFVITGGTVIALGASNMAEAPSENSTQPVIFYNLTDTAAAGSEITLGDIFSYTAPYTFNCLTVSTPDMTIGESYTLTIGSESTEVTLESNVTTLGSVMGGMGGGMAQPGNMGEMGGTPPDMKGESEEMGTPPDMSGEDSTDRPTPPDGTDMGEKGNSEDRPTPPDGTDMGEMGGTPPDMEGGFTKEGVTNDALDETDTDTRSTVTPEFLMLTGVSALALAAALTFAIKYKRR